MNDVVSCVYLGTRAVDVGCQVSRRRRATRRELFCFHDLAPCAVRSDTLCCTPLIHHSPKVKKEAKKKKNIQQEITYQLLQPIICQPSHVAMEVDSYNNGRRGHVPARAIEMVSTIASRVMKASDTMCLLSKLMQMSLPAPMDC